MKIVCFLLFAFVFEISTIQAQDPNWIYYLQSDQIATIAVEGSIVWSGSAAGLAALDKNTDSLTFYNTANSGLPNNYVTAIAIDNNGTKWIATSNGLAAYDGTTWMVYNTSNSGLPMNNLTSIAIDENGVKWIGAGSMWNTGLAAYSC